MACSIYHIHTPWGQCTVEAVLQIPQEQGHFWLELVKLGDRSSWRININATSVHFSLLDLDHLWLLDNEKVDDHSWFIFLHFRDRARAVMTSMIHSHPSNKSVPNQRNLYCMHGRVLGSQQKFLALKKSYLLVQEFSDNSVWIHFPLLALNLPRNQVMQYVFRISSPIWRDLR